MSTELGPAYVQIVPSARGISGSIRSLLEPESKSAGENSGRTFKDRFLANVKKASVGMVADLGQGFTNVAAAGAGAIAGISAAITGSAMSGGISRAIGVDETRAKFKQLGYDADAMTGSIIKGLGQSKYALNEAGATAVNFASAGIKQGKEMEQAIASVASVASISGREFNEIGNIYTKVAAAGKLTGGVMSQLQENGINANAALQKALGKTSEEIEAMVSSGQIDFATFSNAMTEYFGDAGESAMATFSGSLDNIKTVLNRIVAAFAGPALEAVRKFFAGADGQEGLFQALEKIEARLQPLIDKAAVLSEKIGGHLLNSIGEFNRVLDNGGSVMDAFKAAIAELIPDSIKEKFNSLDGGTQQLIIGIGKLLGMIGGGAAIWGGLTGTLSALIPGFGRLLGPLTGAGGAFKIVQGVGASVVDVFRLMTGSTAGVSSGLGKLIMSLGSFAAPAAGIIAALVLMYTKSEAFRNAVNSLVQAVASALIPIIKALMPVFTLAMQIIGKLAEMLGNYLAPKIEMVAKVVTAVAGIITNRINQIKNIITTLTAIVGVVQSTFDRIKAAMINPIEQAQAKVKAILNKIKGFFPLSIGRVFTNLSLPHISVSGGSAPYGIGGKGSLPRFSVTWNAQGGVYDAASIIGIGVGESGREIVTPEELMRQIVSESNQPTQEILVKILRVVEFMADNDMTLEVNRREFGRMVREVQYG